MLALRLVLVFWKPVDSRISCIGVVQTCKIARRASLSGASTGSSCVKQRRRGPGTSSMASVLATTTTLWVCGGLVLSAWDPLLCSLLC